MKRWCEGEGDHSSKTGTPEYYLSPRVESIRLLLVMSRSDKDLNTVIEGHHHHDAHHPTHDKKNSALRLPPPSLLLRQESVQ